MEQITIKGKNDGKKDALGGDWFRWYKRGMSCQIGME